MATANKTLTIGIVAAIVALGVVYFGMNSPPGSGLFGTVAPAERYRAEQSTAEDIKLGDQAIQDFMQTDTFDKLIKNEAFVGAIKNQQFANLLQNQQFVELLDNQQFAELLDNQQFVELLDNQQFVNSMQMAVDARER